MYNFKSHPTKRAPDVWDSAAFSSIFFASSFSCSQALSTPAHTQVTQAVGCLSSEKVSFVKGLNHVMEQAITYKFSKGIRQAKKRYVILSITFSIILFAFLFLNPMIKGFSLTARAGAGLYSFIVIGLSFYFSASRVLRKLSELSVYVFPDRLEREGSKQKEVFFWKDILRADILEYPSGETVSVKLKFMNKKVITLFGFEDMEVARKQISQYIPDKSLIHVKRTKVTWDNPAILILSCVLPLVIMLLIQGIGYYANLFFFAIVFFTTGLHTWIARPISIAQGKEWEKFETVMGILLIIFSIFLLAIPLVIFLVFN